MPKHEVVGQGLRGQFRDVLRDPRGRVTWDSGWRSNAIVVDCRRLLSTFMRGTPAALGIQGLQVGAGDGAWDTVPPGVPPPSDTQTALVDPFPWTVPQGDLQFDFLVGATVSGTPTNRLQISSSLGPNVPNWPDANHATSTLREFALVAQLDGAPVLVNYVTHPAIPKDPASTLERTIWLLF